MRGPAAILLVSIVACAAIAGCVRDFAEPPADRADTAVLIGRNGAYLRAVDGAPVASAKQINSENGNQVRVPAGRHELQVAVVGLQPARWTFVLDAARGETYVIEPQQGTSGGLSVVAQSTGRLIPVK
jgi:hypothetical protein